MRAFVPAALAALALLAGPASAQTPPIRNAFPSLPAFSAPVDLQVPPDGTARLFVVERAGRIRVVANMPSANAAPVFLDLDPLVESGGELGLLGLAFHPQYAVNGRFFVYYTRLHPNPNDDDPYQDVVAEYAVSADPNVASPAGTVLFAVDDPYDNHNAGQLQFGPDGYLYVAMGDGGSGGDPQGNGQNVNALLGKILRIDVDARPGSLPPECGGSPGPYGIPADNPFAGATAGCGEVYAYGFRNPWRFSFGPDGRLWAADVGQGLWEEIDWVTKGGNYGWAVREGAHCYNAATCPAAGLVDPVHEYGHNAAGGYSVTGGYVVPAGAACSAIAGRYVFADYVSRHVWAAAYDGAGVTNVTRIVDGTQSGTVGISTFGLDPANNRVLMAGLAGGRIYEFDCAVLPVELASFEAVAAGAAVRLTWATASETANAGFAVETRGLRGPANPSGPAWREVGFVNGAGTTAERQQYAFDVADLPPGLHAFRLRQVDADGAARYSAEVEATVLPGAPLALRLAGPNPFREAAEVVLAVDAARDVEVAAYDALGRRVAVLYRGALRPEEPVALRLGGGGLPAGVYVIRAAGGAYTATLPVLRAW